MENETRVLLEEIQKSVNTVAEGHGDIIRKLEDHDKKFERIDQRFNTLEKVVADTNARVNCMEQEIGFVKTAVLETNSDVKEMKKGRRAYAA